MEDLQREIAAAREQLARLDADRAGLQARISQLERSTGEDSALSVAAKVRLFGELFQGRRDVYALRWERAAPGRAGYAPACRNEWVAGICEKPRVRCGVCPNQAFRPVTDAVLVDHLKGRVVIGVYPLLADDTCWFAAIDLDGGEWRDDATAVREAAAELVVPVAVERSRSGDGAHVWVVFSEPVPAIQARRLASALLTAACQRRPQIGLGSYDRIIPSQDVLPTGGFGNLIALPLQRAARDHDASVFLNEALVAYPDQWHYLRWIERLSPLRVDQVVGDASRREGGVLGVADAAEEPDVPWRVARDAELPLLGPVPAAITVTVAQQVYVPRGGLPARLIDRIRRLAAFANPVFYERQRLRLPVGHVPRVIGCAEEHAHHIALPRGCLDDLAALLETAGTTIEIDDQRAHGESHDARFVGTLTGDQQAALTALRAHDTGVLVAPPGAGKTVVAAALIGERAVSTLVGAGRNG